MFERKETQTMELDTTFAEREETQTMELDTTFGVENNVRTFLLPRHRGCPCGGCGCRCCKPDPEWEPPKHVQLDSEGTFSEAGYSGESVDHYTAEAETSGIDDINGSV